MGKTVYVLRYDKCRYINNCPVFSTRKEACDMAACKDEKHSVMKVNIELFEPCHPKDADKTCKACAVYYKNLE